MLRSRGVVCTWNTRDGTRTAALKRRNVQQVERRRRSSCNFFLLVQPWDLFLLLRLYGVNTVWLSTACCQPKELVQITRTSCAFKCCHAHSRWRLPVGRLGPWGTAMNCFLKLVCMRVCIAYGWLMILFYLSIYGNILRILHPQPVRKIGWKGKYWPTSSTNSNLVFISVVTCS